MTGYEKKGRRRKTGIAAAGALAGAVTMSLSVLPAGLALADTPPGVSASFNAGVLTVLGDGLDNNIAVSRNAAGALLVNGGAVPIAGGTSTVANTTTITVLGAAGNDTITLSEVNGALPKAILVGGVGNDVLTGGSGNDVLVGQAGNDTLLGKGGFDQLFGGADRDSLTGGDADDQAFGGTGDDRMIWNPGDDTDLDEGEDGADTVEVNGGNGAEQFTETANGSRVRFDRISPAPFSIDIGTSEAVVLRMNGGDDSFSGSNGLAALIATAVDGGDGGDTILGTDGRDFLVGSAGNDFVDGNRGNDVAALGDGEDTFQWDPGDGSDTIAGQDGVDTMLFFGADINENFALSTIPGGARFTRDVGNIVMDLYDLETVDVRSLGGADNLTVGDLTGSGVTTVTTDLSATGGVDDAAADTVTTNGTNGSDVAVVTGSAASTEVHGLNTVLRVTGASAADDSVVVQALAGDDVVDASSAAAGAARLTLDGGEGDDVLLGGDGNDTLLGGPGDDVLLGGGGVDVLDAGPGDNVVIQSAVFAPLSASKASAGTTAAEQAWVQEHVHEVNGRSVLDHDGKRYVLPAADLLP